MILARAGVVRLGWEDLIGETIDAEVILPAVGQGALAIEVRTGDQRVTTLVGGLTHVPTLQATAAERALLRTLEGGCQIPVGTYARINADGNHRPELSMGAMVGSLDGQTIVRAKTKGDPAAAESIGRNLAETLLKMGADRILEQIRAVVPHQDPRSIEA
jgi:hydroxymethylbilane synthase